MDNFLLPTLLIHQFEPARVESLSPIETAEDEVSDEVFLPCWIFQVFTLRWKRQDNVNFV